MTFKEFENTVAAAVKSLPRPFKALLNKNAIKVIPRAKVPLQVKRSHKGETVFGMFIGVPHGRFFNMSAEPTRIEIYKESFDSSFSSSREIKEQILITVMHEVAHYFGFSEEEISRL